MRSVAKIRFKDLGDFKDNINDYALSEFPLSMIYVKGQNEFPIHSHSFEELVVVLAGKGVHFNERDEYQIHAGDVFFINRKERHGYKNTESLELVNIIFLMGRIRIPDFDLRQIPGFHLLFHLEPRYREEKRFEGILRLGINQLNHARKLIMLLKEELERKEPGYKSIAVSLLTELIIFISRNIERKYGQYKDIPLYSMEKVLSHLEENFTVKTSMHKLAKIANMSIRNFQRQFKNITGLTPINYQLNLKMEKAASLFRETSLGVSEVAFKSGFEDSNYFARQFRKIKGMSPREYRGRCLNLSSKSTNRAK